MRNMCVYIDDNTKALLDYYAEKHSISRSATIRMIVNEYFLTEGR